MIYAPRGIPEDYVPIVDADGRIAWVLASDLPIAFVPTFIAIGQTFVVPADTQMLYAMTIDNEGTIDIGDNAFLVMVD